MLQSAAVDTAPALGSNARLGRPNRTRPAPCDHRRRHSGQDHGQRTAGEFPKFRHVPEAKRFSARRRRERRAHSNAMTTYRIVHTTRYDFEEENAASVLKARLRARDLPGQTCRFHQLVVTPLAGQRRAWIDTFGNTVSRVSVPATHSSLEVSAINVVDRTPRQVPALDDSPPWERARPEAGAAMAPDLAPYLMETSLTSCPANLADYARVSFPPGRPVLRAARDLTARIHRDFTYSAGATTVKTTAAETARLGQGVCQDFTHLGIACLRALGLAARYVSGYLDTSAMKAANAPPGGDDSHAWFAIHAPGFSWIDFDPTNDSLADAGYVTLAWGRDYRDAAPLQGSAGGGRHSLRVTLDMTRDDLVSA